MPFLGLGCTYIPLLMSHTSPYGFKSHHKIMLITHLCHHLWLGSSMVTTLQLLATPCMCQKSTWDKLMSCVRAIMHYHVYINCTFIHLSCNLLSCTPCHNFMLVTFIFDAQDIVPCAKPIESCP